jgi:methyl-accepting chemotaxis protein
MDSGTKQVETGVQKAQAAGESLNMIVNNVKDVASMIQNIAAAAEQQGSASEQISRSLENINSVTREATSGASQAAQASSELSNKAEQLRELVSRFKLSEGGATETVESKPKAMRKAATAMKQKAAA